MRARARACVLGFIGLAFPRIPSSPSLPSLFHLVHSCARAHFARLNGCIFGALQCLALTGVGSDDVNEKEVCYCEDGQKWNVDLMDCVSCEENTYSRYRLLR